MNGTAVTVDLTVTTLTGKAVPHLRVNLFPRDGGSNRRPDRRRPGRATYRGNTPECAGGCRIASIEVAQPGQIDFEIDLVIHRVTQAGPDREVTTGERVGGWIASRQPRTEDRLTVGPGPDGGALIHVVASTYGTLDGRIRPPDAAYPLPVLAAGPAPDLLRSLDRREEPSVVVGTTTVLPRVGTLGRLVDLEFLERIAGDITALPQAEVWLGPGAPRDAVERLRAAGLVPGAELTLDGVLTSLAQQGPAVALRFHVATGAIALARPRRDPARRGRRQVRPGRGAAGAADAGRAAPGPRRGVRRGYLWVVIGGVVAGLVAAALAWLVSGSSCRCSPIARRTAPCTGRRRWRWWCRWRPACSY